MLDAVCDQELPAAEGHGDQEESRLSGQDEKVRVPLRCVSTAKLKAALLTTAVGLAIAIPTVALVSHFERRVEAFQQAMESALTRLLTTPRIPA